jgi:hypothetical protein
MCAALLLVVLPVQPAQSAPREILLLTAREVLPEPMAEVTADLHEVHGMRVRLAGEDAEIGARPDVVVVLPSVWLPDPGHWQAALSRWCGQGTGLVVLGIPTDFGDCAELRSLVGPLLPAKVAGGRCFGEWQAKWIWTPPEQGETPDHHRYVRHAFDVPEPPTRAWVRMTADNLYTGYLNGARFGYHWSWYDAELWDVTSLVRVGGNVLAIDTRNVDGPGGLLCEIGLEYPSGKTETIVSDKTWKVSRTPAAGWTELDFDDSSWPHPRQVQAYPGSWSRIPDQPIVVDGHVRLHPHRVTRGIPRRFGRTHELRGLLADEGAAVAAEARGRPLCLLSGEARPRVAAIDGAFGHGSVLTGDSARDLLVQTILWAAGESRPSPFVRFAPPEPEYVVDRVTGPPTWAAVLDTAQARSLELWAEVRKIDGSGFTWHEEIPAKPHGLVGARRIPLDPSPEFEGEYGLTVTAVGPAGTAVAARHARFAVVNRLNARLSVPANRHVTAEGYPITFRAEVTGLDEAAAGSAGISAQILDPWGDPVHDFPRVALPEEDGAIEWAYEPPALECGEYTLRSTITDERGQALDASRLSFHIVPPLELAGLFPTTMRLSPFRTLDKAAIEREIDDIVGHGFNTLTFSAHRLGAEPGSPYDYAEDYAQRRGMAISYSFQGDFSMLKRGAPPAASVYSPEYAEAVRPRIERAIMTAKRVPRLLNVQGYMDEPFQEGEHTFDYSQPTAAEYERRFGVRLPRTDEVRDDPEAFLRYLSFRADYFAAGWRQSYAMVQETWQREMPGRRRFWVELTHDSHNTFGAAAGPSGVKCAIDDVFHWGAPFDSVNYDIYPYLSRDFRTGEFAESPQPRMAGVHMAFAQMRNLATTYGKKLGFWLESGWGDKLKPEMGLADATWSPRELTYTAIGQGCDYLNTFWGIPEDPRWWAAYGEVMNEVKACGPLIARSQRRRARACFVFPRTQHLLLQEEYWNVMVAYEAFLRAYGELDCVHEEQIAAGKLDEYDVIALFDVHCLPRDAADTLRRWVDAGGLLIADEVPQTDERLQPLDVLDTTFGVAGRPKMSHQPAELSDPEHPPIPMTRQYAPADATALPGAPSFADGRPAFLMHGSGAGTTLLMQFPLKDAYLAYLTHEGDGLPELAAMEAIGRVVAETGLEAGVYSSNPGIEACVRETPEGTLILLLINHECRLSQTEVRLDGCPSDPYLQDLVTGKPIAAQMGRPGELVLSADVPFGETRMLGIFPYRPVGVRLTLPDRRAGVGDAIGAVATTVSGVAEEAGSFLVDVVVRGPDGRVREAFSGRRCTSGRDLRLDVRLPVNARRGKWQIAVSLPWTDEKAHASFRVW